MFDMHLYTKIDFVAMKAVQTFWKWDSEIGKDRNWVNLKYEWVSWSLSFFLLKRNFESVSLVCNNIGKEILIDKLGLKYDHVHAVLDEQKEIMDKCWTLGKLFAYALQKEAFVHVDGDAFWFGKPSDKLLKADLFAQNMEINHQVYSEIWNLLKTGSFALPEFLKTVRPNFVIAANVGIVGGNDAGFYQTLFLEAKQFIENNLNLIEAQKAELKFLYLFVEQVFYKELANHKGIQISTFAQPSFKGKYDHITDFVSKNGNGEPEYVHLMSTYKHRIFYLNEMEYWLRYLWPEQWEKIEHLSKSESDVSEVDIFLLDPENEKLLPNKELIFHSPEQAIRYPYVRSQGEFLGEKIQDFDEHKQNDCVKFEEERLSILHDKLKSFSEDGFSNFKLHLNFNERLENKAKWKIRLKNTAPVLSSSFNWFNGLEYNCVYYYELLASSDFKHFQELLLPKEQGELLEILKYKNEYTLILEEFTGRNKSLSEKHLLEILKEMDQKGYLDFN